MTWDGRIRADARQLPIADECVQTVVTSPPYWNLRKYDVGGLPTIGNESSLEEYIESIRQVFREVWRVLKSDGVIWVNMGDCYANGKPKEGYSSTGSDLGWNNKPSFRRDRAPIASRAAAHSGVVGLKPKDLIGLPWLVAFALRNDGWYLRQEIIWHKTQAMPESIKDRPTRAHEQLFLLSKSLRYYYDADAIKEPASPDTHSRYSRAHKGYSPPGQEPHHGYAVGQRPNIAKQDGYGRRHAGFNERYFGLPGVTPKSAERASGIKANADFHANCSKEIVERVNKRSVWSLGTAAYPEAHYATFPPDLVEPCILAGSRAGDIVLDPFAGSGTVGRVAEQYSRRWIGVDLGYQDLQAKRMKNIQKVLVATE